jgi:hypothetical protein
MPVLMQVAEIGLRYSIDCCGLQDINTIQQVKERQSLLLINNHK